MFYAIYQAKHANHQKLITRCPRDEPRIGDIEKGRTVHSASQTAFLLSLIAPLFSHLNEEDYGYVLQNAAWQQVRETAGLPGSRPYEALELSSWEARSAFQNELLVSGMPLAAMPVESLYKPWSAQAGNAFGASRGLYLGDPARHLDDVYRALAIDVPGAFASMPDHLTLELELMAMLLVAGNERAVRELATDHLDWLDDYDAALAVRADMVAQNVALPPCRRRNLLDGIGFVRALVALARRLVQKAAAIGASEARVAV